MSQVIVVSPAELSDLVRRMVRTGVHEALRDMERDPAAMTTDEAASYLGLSPATMRQWRSQGRGPAYLKNGSRVTYLVHDLDAWRDANRVKTVEALESEPRKAVSHA